MFVVIFLVSVSDARCLKKYKAPNMAGTAVARKILRTNKSM